jgi:uncharacterized membrane protein YgcG
MTRFLYLTTIAAALAAIPFAGPAAARFEAGGGGGAAASTTTAASTASGNAAEPAEVENEAAEVEQNEAVGTVTTDGVSVTVTRANGTSISCAVPVGVDLTPFVSGQAKAECDLVNGVLTLRELRSATARVEVGEDDQAENEDVDDNSGPSANSGPGNAEDDQGDDNSGPGGGDQGDDGGLGGGGDDGGHGGHGGGDD